MVVNLPLALCNVGSLPWNKRRGAATALIRWSFEEGNKDEVVVYLETDQDGRARRKYERLGFTRAGAAVFELLEYGGSGVHTRITIFREPHGDGC